MILLRLFSKSESYGGQVAQKLGPRTTCLPAPNAVRQAGRRDDAAEISFQGRTIRTSAPRTRFSRPANRSATGSALPSTSPTFTTKPKQERRAFYFSGGGELLQLFPDANPQEFRRGNKELGTVRKRNGEPIMNKIILGCMLSLLASCASNSVKCIIDIDRTMLISDALETHAYDYCCPKGYTIEVNFEVFLDGKKVEKDSMRVTGQASDSRSKPISANRGIVLTIFTLDWLGKEYLGKCRISLNADGKKSKSVVIQNPRGVPGDSKVIQGGGSLVGSVEFLTDGNPQDWEPKVLLHWSVNKYEVKVTVMPVKIPLSNY